MVSYWVVPFFFFSSFVFQIGRHEDSYFIRLWLCALCWVPLLGNPVPQREWIDLTYPFNNETIYWPTALSFNHTKVHEGFTAEGFTTPHMTSAAPDMEASSWCSKAFLSREVDHKPNTTGDAYWARNKDRCFVQSKRGTIQSRYGKTTSHRRVHQLSKIKNSQAVKGFYCERDTCFCYEYFYSGTPLYGHRLNTDTRI